jgi:hypothetical protein
MGKVVGIGVVFLALAVGFVLLTEKHEIVALFAAFRDQPPQAQIAWAVIVFVPFALLVCAVWLSYALMPQRRGKAARRDAVRESMKGLARGQVDAETAVHHLVRTDPEDALAVLQQRLTEAERFAQIQQSRNEATDLQSRVEYIRAQQQALKERLAPVLERRRSIEHSFMELESYQKDVDHSLYEIASGEDAVGLEISLRNMMETVKRSHTRCDDIERASKMIAGLREDYAELRARLTPFAASDSGVLARLKELRDASDQLTADIDSLLLLPEGPLTERLLKFAQDKKALEIRLSELNEEFAKLSALRRDISALFGGFNRALDVLAINQRGDSPADVEARTHELAKFIEVTQTQLDDVEHRLGLFGQLRTKLGEVESRLLPLESEDTGVIRLVEDLKEVRDRIAARIRRMEESDEGDLTARLKRFSETKRELEERVVMLNEQFIKLADIRKDIAGLFDKLSGAISAAAN